MGKAENQEKPVFVLGVGAQKAGTTWLHRYLSKYNCSDFGAIKEYHIWDILHIKEVSVFDARTKIKCLQETQKQSIRASMTGFSDVEVRFKFQTNPEQYFDYFAELLKQENIRLTGDISPSYCGLPIDVLEKIKTNFAKRDIDVRVVFLMRDPFDRLWSAIRMYKRKGRIKEGMNLSQTDEEALLTYMLSPHAKMRNSYHETLENLHAVFKPEDIFVGIHENMFTEDEIRRLSKFLNLEPFTDFGEKKVNVSPVKETVSQSTRDQVRAQYSDVYKYCAEKYPQVIDLWHMDG